MKLGLNANYPKTQEDKRGYVPMQFIRVGMDVLSQATDLLQTYNYDQYVEVIKVEFIGTTQKATMVVKYVVSVRLFDLNAVSRREGEREFQLDHDEDPKTKGITAQLVQHINGTIGEILNKCKRQKIRYMCHHLVVEPA